MCGMLGALVRQNRESKPHKRRDFALREPSSIVAKRDVALTLPLRRRQAPPSTTASSCAQHIAEPRSPSSAMRISAPRNLPPLPAQRPE